jgi:hypothetical protein
MPARRFSKVAAKAWYRKWVAENIAAGTQPSREKDAEAAREALGVNVPRDFLRELRRELAPAAWKSHGRPSGSS